MKSCNLMSAGRTAIGDRNIFLIGFMGAGKTTIGRVLAQKLSRTFVDTDALIEEKAGKSIPEIFTERGEGYFRDLESEVIEAVAASQNYVVALGGGTVLRDANWQKIRRSGATVYLKWKLPTLLPRIVNDRNRPLLRVGSGVDSNLEKIERLFLQRSPLYERAEIVLNCQNNLEPAIVADKIVERLLQKT
ncbi:MAG: shikimate kinase [bacterium]